MIFSPGDPKYTANFSQQTSCNVTPSNPTCQVNVPYLSTIIASVIDSTGTYIIYQDPLQFAFFDGNMIRLDKSEQGDYFFKSQIFGNFSNGMYTYLAYDCHSYIEVSPPDGNPTGRLEKSDNVLETCSNFNSEITMFDVDNTPIVIVNFDIATDFQNFLNPSIDFRTITVNNVTLPIHNLHGLEVALDINSGDDYIL